MRDIPYIITDNAVQMTFDGKTRVIKREDSRYDEVMDAIRSEDWETVVEVATREDEAVSKIREAGLEVEGGFVRIDGVAVDGELNTKILQFVEEGLPVGRLVRFYRRLTKNSSFRIRRDLFEFINKTGHPITEDGSFIAYKRVRENFKDCHTGKFDNSVGRVVKMERSLVDDDPNNTCSAGLHVANHNYASHFYPNGILLDVKVAPENVVSIPTDYSGEKMRCCEYEVLAVSGGLREEVTADVDEDFDEEEWDEEWDHEFYDDPYEPDGDLLDGYDLGAIEERGYSAGYDDYNADEDYNDSLPDDLDCEDDDVVSTWKEAYEEGHREAKEEDDRQKKNLDEKLHSAYLEGYNSGYNSCMNGDVFQGLPPLERGFSDPNQLLKWSEGYVNGWNGAEDNIRKQQEGEDDERLY